jgi:hypothetical protein
MPHIILSLPRRAGEPALIYSPGWHHPSSGEHLNVTLPTGRLVITVRRRLIVLRSL